MAEKAQSSLEYVSLASQFTDRLKKHIIVTKDINEVDFAQNGTLKADVLSFVIIYNDITYNFYPLALIQQFQLEFDFIF